MCTLDQIRVGGKARVTGIEGDRRLVQRLLEMGLIDGERVCVAGRAPLGDPIEIRLRDYRLSLRTSEAKLVRVAPIADEPNAG
jgi:Fe2+ transport system protein FeoA